MVCFPKKASKPEKVVIDIRREELLHSLGVDEALIQFGKRVERRPRQLHVLLRHRLLRKPGGFEGFLQASKPREPADLAVSEGPHVELGLFNGNPAPRPTRP